MAYVYWIRLINHTDVFSEGYVGVTTQKVSYRFSQHLNQSKKSNLPLYNAIRKHGKENIIVETVLIGDVDYVYDVESLLRPSDRIGWNCAKGGDKSSLGRVAKKRTLSHSKALSLSLTGREFSDEHKLSLSLSQKKRWESKDRYVGSGSNCNESVWSIADKIYLDRLNGLSGGKICKKYGIKKLSNIHSLIYVHFKRGWIPNKDEAWISKYGVAE